MNKRRLLAGLAVAGALGCCCTGWPVGPFNPARQSPEAIRAALLKETPPGASVEAVLALARERGWPARAFEGDDSPKCVHAEYGWYQALRDFPFATIVRVTWQFDEQGRLRDISVWTTLDAP